MDARIGQELHHYTVEKLLGEGRLGPLYQGVDRRCAQAVAVKLLAAPWAEEPRVQQHLLTWLSPAIYFNHPGLVRVFDVEQHQNQTFVILELLPGPTLAHLFAAMRSSRRWIAATEALALVRDLGAAVEYARQHGDLRRRLLPSKIRFRLAQKVAAGAQQPPDSRRFRPVVADLGIDLNHALRERLHNQQLLTPEMLAYIPPEELQNQVPDQRGDVFTFAALMLELVAGQPIFRVKDVYDALNAHVNQQVRVRQLLRTGQPEPLVALLERALSSKPAERPASVQELVRLAGEIADDALPESLPQDATAGITTLLHEFETYRPVTDEVREKAPKASKAPPPADAPAQHAPSVATAPLVGVEIINQEGKSRLLTISQAAASIGRAPGNAIVLEDTGKRISREHAQMKYVDGHWHIEDRQSGNGTQLDNRPLTPNHPVPWTAGAVVQIEGYRLRLVAPPRAEAAMPGEAAAPGVAPVAHIHIQSLGADVPRTRILFSPGDARIGLFVEQPMIDVVPGGSAQCTLVALNQSAAPLQLHGRLTHSLMAGVTLEPAAMQLQPGEQRLLVLTVAPERSTHCRPGLYPLQVTLSDQAAQTCNVTGNLRVNIKSFSEYRVQIYPPRASIGSAIEIEIDNDGNATQEFVVMIWDDRKEVSFSPHQVDLRIEAGERATASVKTSATRTHLFGARQHTATVQVSAAGGETRTSTVELVGRGALG